MSLREIVEKRNRKFSQNEQEEKPIGSINKKDLKEMTLKELQELYARVFRAQSGISKDPWDPKYLKLLKDVRRRIEKILEKNRMSRAASYQQPSIENLLRRI